MLNAAREYQRPSDKGARGKEQEVETERKERQGEGGRERELVRIFPRVLTAPAREKRATIDQCYPLWKRSANETTEHRPAPVNCFSKQRNNGQWPSDTNGRFIRSLTRRLPPDRNLASLPSQRDRSHIGPPWLALRYLCSQLLLSSRAWLQPIDRYLDTLAL